MSNLSFKDQQAALGFLIEQTTHIEQQVNETQYPDIQYPQLIPVDTSANPFSTSVTYFSSDKYGQAKWINGNADDIPLAGSTREKHQVGIHTAAIGYSYGWEEINQAMMLGIALTADDARAARRAADEMIDRVALLGAPEKGFPGGLFNHPDVTAHPVDGGPWETKTADEIIADINACLCHVHSQTLGIAMADTLLVPFELWCIIAGRRVTDTNETIASFIARNNIYTATTGAALTIRAARGLSTAGEGGVGRVVAYRRSPEVLKLHLPMPHRFLEVYHAGPIRWEVPGVFRLGGLDVRRPGEVTYCDGVSEGES